MIVDMAGTPRALAFSPMSVPLYFPFLPIEPTLMTKERNEVAHGIC